MLRSTNTTEGCHVPSAGRPPNTGRVIEEARRTRGERGQPPDPENREHADIDHRTREQSVQERHLLGLLRIPNLFPLAQVQQWREGQHVNQTVTTFAAESLQCFRYRPFAALTCQRQFQLFHIGRRSDPSMPVGAVYLYRDVEAGAWRSRWLPEPYRSCRWLSWRRR